MDETIDFDPGDGDTNGAVGCSLAEEGGRDFVRYSEVATRSSL